LDADWRPDSALPEGYYTSNENPNHDDLGRFASGSAEHVHYQGAIASIFHRNIDRSELSEGRKREYMAGVTAAIGAMSPRALQRLRANVKGVRFHEDRDGLTEYLRRTDKGVRDFLEEVEEYGGKHLLGGAYDSKSKSLDLDGGATATQEHGLGCEHYHAHELTHALDGHHEISGTPEWQEAWKAEANTGRLTKQATRSAAEALAEFGRCRLTGYKSEALLRKHFPKCWAVWEKYLE
jgi:hypothetical protein